jgi:ABC-type sugar transport system substrate-binding protein
LNRQGAKDAKKKREKGEKKSDNLVTRNPFAGIRLVFSLSSLGVLGALAVQLSYFFV